MEETKLLDVEILEIVLSGISKGKEFSKLERQLEKILRTDRGELSKRFKSHKIYGDYSELHQSLVLLESGDALPGRYSGLDCQSQKVADFVYRKSQSLEGQLEPEVFDYLHGVGGRIDLLNKKTKSDTEIEVKYLISENGKNYAHQAFWDMFHSIYSFKKSAIKSGISVKQGYFNEEEGNKLSDILFATELDFVPNEFRIRNKGNTYYFTIKEEGNLVRKELEMKISKKTFNKYWPRTSGKRIIKKRLQMPYQNYIVEIDAYLYRDLIVAEIEVPTIERANNLSPLGKNITNDMAYKNKNLTK